MSHPHAIGPGGPGPESKIVTERFRVARMRVAPLWSVPTKLNAVTVIVPFATPVVGVAVRLNVRTPGPTFVNVNFELPLRTPPALAASSETYVSSGGRVTFTQIAAAEPVPVFVRFTVNVTKPPAWTSGEDAIAENERLGWRKP